MRIFQSFTSKSAYRIIYSTQGVGFRCGHSDLTLIDRRLAFMQTLVDQHDSVEAFNCLSPEKTALFERKSIVRTIVKKSEPHQHMLMDLPPEKLIVRVAEQRDKDAFSALFDLFAPRIKAFLMRGGSTTEAAAEELTQEALLTVWRKAHSYSSSRGSAAAWIFTIARNLRIDEARRSKRAQLYEALDDFDQPEPDQPDDLVSAGEHAVRVRDAMSALPQEQLEVVKWSFVEGAAHSEIAERLDLPLGTVKSRLRLAMRRMRKSLEDLA